MHPSKVEYYILCKLSFCDATSQYVCQKLEKYVVFSCMLHVNLFKILQKANIANLHFQKVGVCFYTRNHKTRSGVWCKSYFCIHTNQSTLTKVNTNKTMYTAIYRLHMTQSKTLRFSTLQEIVHPLATYSNSNIIVHCAHMSTKLPRIVSAGTPTPSKAKTDTFTRLKNMPPTYMDKYCILQINLAEDLSRQKQYKEGTTSIHIITLLATMLDLRLHLVSVL